ncbi:glutamate-cysteine ligase family protein [Candidatus Nitrospira allomarina]|jgi:glutamate-cysteine ligase|uniref:Glutamate-cysteine ligase family protein n=1 Tax=Candidatus Nitrospira allomarina TaxID=3020900 RepID=A0AA96G8R1_9BACT|nr:glutamate-cysteine ligase family protein [Candidatus Nitrospira allomarina]WNM56961.1 glutamate-cysteine ligase family protein [Candidatus Nitrospira allomarina]
MAGLTQTPFHQRIVIGVEIEAYSINVTDHKIGRRLSKPRPGLSESGERFTRDASIGSEYNSRPFTTIRESLFLLKAGLRKYLRGLYRSREDEQDYRVPLFVGGWTNRFAGTHLHISVANRKLTKQEATALSWHLHDQLPLLIATGANSPIWDKKVTGKASNRFLRGNATYFTPTKRGDLTSVDTRELVYSKGRKTKPPTLEIRVFDSNIPEFVVANLCLVKAVCLRWLRGEAAANRMSHADYLLARTEAATKGMKARLPWKREWMPAPDYLDQFLWEHREEFDAMDIPEEIYEVLRLLKRRYNGARLIHDAVALAIREHPQTWQRRFAKRYRSGLGHLLSGNTLQDFAAELEVPFPSTERVWLGRKRASIDE